MARKNYSEEFRRQAVDLYECTPGVTLKGIAADLGVVRGTLKHWVDQYGTGKKTGPDRHRHHPADPRRRGALAEIWAKLQIWVPVLAVVTRKSHHR